MLITPLTYSAQQVNAGLAVRSNTAASGVEQAAAVKALESEGKLAAQLGLGKLSRDAVFIQSERDVKVKLSVAGDQVTSSNESDFDEERTLDKVDDKTDLTPRLDRLKSRAGRDPGNTPLPSRNDEALAVKPAQNNPAQARAAEVKPAAQQAVQDHAQQQPRFDTRGEAHAPAPAPRTDKAEPPRKSVIGKPTSIYSTLQSVLTPQKPQNDDEPLPELDVLA